MKGIRRVHPSATLFVGILLAFSLPFGYSAQACGGSTDAYRGVDLLRARVGPEGSDYADEIAVSGAIFSWLLFLCAVLGLYLAVMAHGRLWATFCALAAFSALLLLAGAEMSETYIGWELAFFLPLGGLVLKILVAIGRRLRRLLQRRTSLPSDSVQR